MLQDSAEEGDEQTARDPNYNGTIEGTKSVC
jgi:hypothetical protein